MSSLGSVTDPNKPLYTLEEQLARQKAILANCALVQKLPDKGAKVRASVARLEVEIEQKRKEREIKQAQMSPREIEEMEWALRSISFVQSPLSKSQKNSGGEENYESGDKQEVFSVDESVLKMIATSQISQREPKTVIVLDKELKQDSKTAPKSDSANLDRFTSRIVKTDSKKPEDELKFVPSKSVKTKCSGSCSPTGSASSCKSSDEKPSKGWDESLLPPKQSYEGAKLMSMEDTLRMESEKIKEFEALKLQKPHKIYAYDRLKSEGLLGNYSVEMQTTRPMKTDIADDELDEDDDLSDDRITEESETSDIEEENQRTSKHLSDLTNSNLKIKK